MLGQIVQGLRHLTKAAIKGHLRRSERDQRTVTRASRPSTAWKGSISPETDWISFCQVEIVGGKLQVHDATGPPTDGPLPPGVRQSYGTLIINGEPRTFYYRPDPLVDVPPGHYGVAVRCMQWGEDRRVSRLRVLLKGRRGQRGEEVGAVSIDTAKCGVCDPEVFSAAWRAHPGGEVAATNELEYQITGGALYGAVALDEQHGAVMVFVRSGFGDGGYPVYELISRSKRVGVEVVFINESEPYPF
jgi:hypothetical protein